MMYCPTTSQGDESSPTEIATPTVGALNQGHPIPLTTTWWWQMYPPWPMRPKEPLVPTITEQKDSGQSAIGPTHHPSTERFSTDWELI